MSANKDLDRALDSYRSQVSLSSDPNYSFNPALEVQGSLVGLLKHRINKIQDDLEFEVTIKEAILARLDEAQFGELLQTLNTIQLNTNVSVEKILAPFIAKSDQIVLSLTALENARNAKIEERVTDTSSQEEMKALQELTKLLNYSKRNSNKQGEISEDSGSTTDTALE